MSNLAEGKKAPLFNLNDQNANLVSLKDFKGKYVVLYFYPKDNTSGCTREACSFRDEFPKFKKLNAVIIGVSPDSVQSHKKFAEKYELPFTLISDEDGSICESFGVWGEKTMMGRKYMGIERATFLIDKNGIIRHIWRKVKAAGHAEEVLTVVKSL